MKLEPQHGAGSTRVVSRSVQSIRVILKWVYAPLFFVGFNAMAVHVVGSGASRMWLALLLLAAIAASFAAERIAPYEAAWNRPRGDVARDVVHASVNETLSVVTVASIPLLAVLVPWPARWVVGWPLGLQLALAILVADAGITLVHFASHRIAILWRLHAVHHSVIRLIGFNGLVKHPLHQAIETAAGAAPLVLLGMPLEVGALLGFAVALQLMLQHSNVDMRLGPLTAVWAVAPVHRHHHLASGRDGDVNFGLFTTIWDRLLGTVAPPRPTPRDGEIGVAGSPDYPTAYWAQLVEPFRLRWSRARAENHRAG